ncbi:MAG: carbohydrate-binding domain-containing protein [Bacteroidales bacterium]|nr:carbohydrate-binding domain-containing protein [Bacteroidales bacterium]
MKNILYIPLALLLLAGFSGLSCVSGCTGDDIEIVETDSGSSSGTGTTVISTDTTGNSGTVIISLDDEESEDNINNTAFDRTVKVIFSTSGNATVTGASDSLKTVIDGNGVTITNISTERVVYELSGTTADGYFKVYSERKQAIVLNGVSITNKSGAAINNQGKKRCFVVVEGSNILADGKSYTATPDGEDEKAAFFSEGQLIFSGEGSLKVTAQGKAGITSDDYIRVMSSPSITVTSSAGHGFRGKDAIVISGGTIDAQVSADMKKGFSSDSLVMFTGGNTTIKVTGNAGYDSDDQDYSGSAGIKADRQFLMSGGTVTITNSGTGGKGIKVGSSNDRVALPASEISGGTLTVTTTGANYTKGDVSSKGIKIGWAVKSGNKISSCSGNLTVSGGVIKVVSSKSEAIEVKGEITVTDGEVYAQSSGDDAINSGSTFTVSGGYLCGISTANDALDANGNFYIKGGVVFASGKSSPDLAIDANTEGGFKLYVQGGILFTMAGLESGASLSQSCYSSTASLKKDTWYSLTVDKTTYAFKTPSTAYTPLVVSGASQPSVKSGVTVNGGTSRLGGMMIEGGSVSGGSSVSLSTYSGGNSGPGGNMGPGGWH